MRMPLQAGNSALRSLLSASALLVPAGLLTLAALWLVFELDIDGDVAFWVLALPGGLLFFAFTHLKQAAEMRPSDIEVDAEGFKVFGGPRSGMAVGWTQVVSCTLRTRPSDGKLAAVQVPIKVQTGELVDPDDVLEVVLTLKGDEKMVLAASEDATEVASLHDVAAALEGGRKQLSATPTVADLPPSVVRCPQCQAPVRPAATATVRCPFCAAEVPLPEALREKIRAAQLVSRRPARLVASVLRQPRAGFVGAIYVVAALFMLTAWPVAITVLLVNASRGTFHWSNLGFVAIFLVSCLLGFFGVIRGWLVDRHALRLLVTGFCARRPAEANKPLECRACFAPLPEGAPKTLVRCAYCDAPNVLAVDFTPQAKQLDDERSSLDAALHRRSTERRRWRGAALAGALLVVLSGWALRRSFAPAPLPVMDSSGHPSSDVTHLPDDFVPSEPEPR